MTVKLSEIEKVAEGATPGPWSADLDEYGETRGIWPEVPGEEIVVGCFVAADGYDSVGFQAGTDENLAFIAASRTAIPALTAALREVLALHRPVEVEPSDTICAACSSVRGTGDSLRYFPYTEWPCATVDAITAQVDPT